MSNSRDRKPKDMSSNVNRIRDIVRNTEENLNQEEISMEFADPSQYEEMSEKNERRKQSIKELKDEVKDEIAKSKKGKV